MRQTYSDFQIIWLLARVNQESWQVYESFDDLPRTPIQWPTNTQFQRRLEEVRKAGMNEV